MIKEIKLPDLGEGIDSAEVSEIQVSVGDVITADQTILVLESDKASMEIPSEVKGTVSEIYVEVGNDDFGAKSAIIMDFQLDSHMVCIGNP